MGQHLSEERETQTRPATRDDAPALATLMRQLGYPTTPDEMAARLDAILPDDEYYTAVAY